MLAIHLAHFFHLGGFADRISETLTETGRGRVRESNNGVSFRKSIRTFSSTGCEPNKIFGSVLWSAASATFILHCIRPISLTVTTVCMDVQTLPNLHVAKLQVCFQKSSGGGYFSLFTDVLLHVLWNCASRSIALQKLKLKVCPGCCLVERESRASILDWVSIGKPKFSFFVFLVRRKKESKTDNVMKEEEIEKGDYGPSTRKVCC